MMVVAEDDPDKDEEEARAVGEMTAAAFGLKNPCARNSIGRRSALILGESKTQRRGGEKENINIVQTKLEKQYRMQKIWTKSTRM
jgi:hypothetical protein